MRPMHRATWARLVAASTVGALAWAVPIAGASADHAGEPADLVVDTTVDAYDGSCRDGDCSLRDAVRTVRDGGVIEVPPGFYPLTLPEAGTPNDGVIEVDRSMTIRGRGDAGAFLDGSNLGSSIFRIRNRARVHIASITAFGSATGPAGFADVDRGRLVLYRLTVSGGDATHAGAVLVRDTGRLTARRSAFLDNRGGYGGAITARGRARILDSSFDGNRSASGGAITVGHAARVELRNVTLSDNRARRFGGGLSVAGVATLESVTLVGNTSGEGGGGLWMSLRRAEAHVGHSIVAGNTVAGTAGDCGGGHVISEGYNVSSSRSCDLDAPTDREGVDPQAGRLRSNGGPTPTRALRPSSPAIDVGGACSRSDQRDAPRAGRCDAGAYELVRCAGRPADIVGTRDADELSGGREPDTFIGLGGDDEFQGSLQDDRACGDGGNDLLIGGPGPDRMKGDAGDDRLEGEDGNDLLIGGRGRDLLIGGPGIDTCIADRRDRTRGCERVR